MKKPLKQVIQNQMKNISLDDEQLERLMQMQVDGTQESVVNTLEKIKKTKLTNNRLWMAVASMMVIILTLGVLASQYYLNQSSERLIQKIANEVAGNHLKMKPMEVKTVAINDIQDYFTKLDFMPYQSQHLNLQPQHIQYRLAGARYCSIQGSTAAQLRYRDNSKDTSKNRGRDYITLFETPNNPELFKEIPDRDRGGEPIVTYAKGIKVTIWQERGLLMVSTEKP